MFPKPNSLEILPRWYVSFQHGMLAEKARALTGRVWGRCLWPTPKVPLQTANIQNTKIKDYERGDLKIMRCFVFHEILGLVLRAMFSSTLFPQAVLEIHCILNENWGCPSCFPYKGLGREVSPAEVHSLQENLGGFFLSSERHIEHQGNNKNWAEELGQNTRHRYRQRYWIYLRGTKYIQFVPHPRAQGPLISLAVLFLLSSDKVLLA